MSPLELDGSGASVCEKNPVPANSDCRYVIVPTTIGGTTTQSQELEGAQSNGFQQSDATTSTFTTGSSNSYNTGWSFGGGPMIANLKTQQTWTWTDTQNSGTSTGEGNSMSVTLKTSTATCGEYVNIFEDTLFKTYAFQTPAVNTTCP